MFDKLLRRANLEKEISIGGEAKMILEHPLVVGFFADYESQLCKSWRNSPPGQEGEETRDVAYHMIGVLDAFKAKLRSHISTAESAKPRLAEVNEEIEADEKKT